MCGPVIPFSVGLAAGFFTSVGIGPITLTAVSRLLRNGLKAGLAVAAGAALMDLLVLFLIGVGINLFVIPLWLLILFGCLTGSVFVFVGIRKVQAVPSDQKANVLLALEHPSPASNEKLHHYVATGMILYAANPGFILLWLGVVSAVHSNQLLDFGFLATAFFASGAALGTFVLLSIVLLSFQKFSRKHSVLWKVMTVESFMNIAVGLIMFVQCLYVSFHG